MKRNLIELFIYDIKHYGLKLLLWVGLSLFILAVGTVMVWIYSWPAKFIWGLLDSLV